MEFYLIIIICVLTFEKKLKNEVWFVKQYCAFVIYIQIFTPFITKQSGS